MPENIETSLNWPESGLKGVPDAEGPLTYTMPSHERHESDEHAGDEATVSLDEDLQFTTQLDFGANPLGEHDAGYISQPLFGDRPDAFTASDHHLIPTAGNTISWPPLVRTRRRPLWSRMLRSGIALPLLLIVILALGAGGYKAYKHFTKSTIVPAASTAGIAPNAAVKVVHGPACRAGHTTTTVELAASRAANGYFYIATTGKVANSGSSTLHGLAVHVLITYADGAQTTQTVLANKGEDIPAKSTKVWFGSVEDTDGSVPPVQVAISSVGATSPTLSACQ
ncbi:MAG TPA: hypothetical protein VGH31_11025 [Acidimicrobiales bacterium]